MHQINHSPSYPTSHDSLHGRDPNFYWKQNYHYNKFDHEVDSLGISPFEDRIQAHSLLEHKQVIIYLMSQVAEAVRHGNFQIEQPCAPSYSVLNFQFTDNLLQLLIQKNMLTRFQLLDLNTIFAKRNDWRKLCVQLIQMVDSKYHCQLTYAFYISLKIVVQIRSYVRLTCLQLRSLLNRHIATNMAEIEQKLGTLSKTPEFEEKIQKICLTMMLAIYGIFTNPFYNPSEQKFKQLQFSIKQQENKWVKEKKIRIKNIRWRQSCLCRLVERE